MSVAWSLEAPSQDVEDGLRDWSREVQGMEIEVKAVKAKVGNNLTSIPLGEKIRSLNGIIEKD